MKKITNKHAFVCRFLAVSFLVGIGLSISGLHPKNLLRTDKKKDMVSTAKYVVDLAHKLARDQKRKVEEKKRKKEYESFLQQQKEDQERYTWYIS